jgi:hypothetical protein
MVVLSWANSFVCAYLGLVLASIVQLGSPDRDGDGDPENAPFPGSPDEGWISPVKLSTGMKNIPFSSPNG